MKKWIVELKHTILFLDVYTKVIGIHSAEPLKKFDAEEPSLTNTTAFTFNR